MKRLLVATLVALIVAMLGAPLAAASSSGSAVAGQAVEARRAPKVAVIVGPVAGITDKLPSDGQGRRPDGPPLHPQRRRGVLAERDVAPGRGRHRRRVDRHLPRPRQRLAVPVPRLALPGHPEWLRIEPRRRRGRRGAPVLRGGVARTRSSSHPTRSSCSTTCATPVGTPSPGCPKGRSTRPSSESTTTPRGSSERAPAPLSPRATSHRRGTCSSS